MGAIFSQNGAAMQSEQNALLGGKAFLEACSTGDLPTIETMLEDGLDVNQRGKHQMSGLTLAVIGQQNHVVGLLLSHASTSVNCADRDRNSPLHWAAAVDNVGALDQLVGAPGLANLNILNKGGDSPLMVAVGCGALGATRRLLTIQGIHKETRNRRGMTLEQRAR